MKETLPYERLSDNKVRCNLCVHHCCVIADGRSALYLAAAEGRKRIAQLEGPADSVSLGESVERDSGFRYLSGNHAGQRPGWMRVCKLSGIPH